jgi:phosphoribosylglycinamide formyltransferase 2
MHGFRQAPRRPSHRFTAPETEAIRTEVLEELEAQGQRVAPSAGAAALAMNRDRTRYAGEPQPSR